MPAWHLDMQCGEGKVSVFACEIRVMFQSQRPRTAARCRHTHASNRASSRLALCQRGFATTVRDHHKEHDNQDSHEQPARSLQTSKSPGNRHKYCQHTASLGDHRETTSKTPETSRKLPGGLGGLAAKHRKNYRVPRYGAAFGRHPHQDASSPCLLGLKPV